MAVHAGFLVHKGGDDVAIAVRDMPAGAATVSYLDSGATQSTVALERIPLGHKVALRDLEQGAHVKEYGETIGVMYEPVRAGGLVHVHNLRSARWTQPG